MDSLFELAKRCPLTDKNTAHSYFPVYEEILRPYRELPITLLEVGVSYGDSLKLWDAYFTSAKVWGADNNPDCFKDDRVVILDATKAEEVERAFGPILFDIIIEDASHAIWDQVAIFKNLKPHLAEGGLYVIEDVADLDTPPRMNGLANTKTYQDLWPGHVEIRDRRGITGRWDDVMVVIK